MLVLLLREWISPLHLGLRFHWVMSRVIPINGSSRLAWAFLQYGRRSDPVTQSDIYFWSFSSLTASCRCHVTIVAVRNRNSATS
jgi:hypothetical protein